MTCTDGHERHIDMEISLHACMELDYEILIHMHRCNKLGWHRPKIIDT